MLKYKNQPDEKAFYEARKDQLDFAKDSIQTNIETGITTPESYCQGLKKYLQKTNALM